MSLCFLSLVPALPPLLLSLLGTILSISLTYLSYISIGVGLCAVAGATGGAVLKAGVPSLADADADLY